MDPTQPEWLRAGLARSSRAQREVPLTPLTPLRRRRPPRRSRRGFLVGAGLAGAAVAGGALAVSGTGDGAIATRGAEAIGRLVPGLAAGPAPTATPARPALAAPLTYVAIGASDATGLGARDPGREGWVPLLAQGLPQGTRLVNLGVPGITLNEAVARVLPRAVNAQPGLVTVWLVVNDVLAQVPLERYRADLNRLLEGLRAGTQAQLAVGNLPDPPGSLGGIELPGFVRRGIIGQWNAAIADVTRAHDAILVDLFRRWPVGEHPEFIGPDGLHPTAAGYRSLATVFLDTLRDERLLS